WSSDVCSSDLPVVAAFVKVDGELPQAHFGVAGEQGEALRGCHGGDLHPGESGAGHEFGHGTGDVDHGEQAGAEFELVPGLDEGFGGLFAGGREFTGVFGAETVLLGEDSGVDGVVRGAESVSADDFLSGPAGEE